MFLLTQTCRVASKHTDNSDGNAAKTSMDKKDHLRPDKNEGVTFSEDGEHWRGVGHGEEAERGAGGRHRLP